MPDPAILPPFAPTRFQPGDWPEGVGGRQLEELIGVVGFGEVWKARDPLLPTTPPVVLAFCLDADARRQLLADEARIILRRVQAQGRLPGIVPLLHSYLGADPPCLEFEFVEGGDLAGLIREWHAGGTASVLDAARLIQKLGRAIGQAHRLSPPIVHCDIQPGNVLVQRLPDGTLSYHIADFGIGGLAARRAVRSVSMGGSDTPLYASPQLMAGETADPRDDVYSLGVLWFQMLTGDLERGAPTGDAWKLRLRERGGAPELERLLQSCLERDRDGRPADGEELAARIEKAMAPRRTMTRRAALTLAVASPLGLGVCAAGLWWPKPRKEPVVEYQGQPSPEPKNWPPGLAKPMTNSIGMRFARIPAGKFMRGSPEADKSGAKDERPRREVEIGKGFYLGVYVVTQAEYHRVMGGPAFSEFEGDLLPVERVNHTEAEEFCEKLSAREEERDSGRLYRLPTEAEWEYACRAGARAYQPFHFGDTLTSEQANIADNLKKTTEVGNYPPNAWGLYDMHGNVWEWCADWYDGDYYREGGLEDPRGPRSGTFRAMRGGSWHHKSQYCRSASRARLNPATRFYNCGFRVYLE